MNVTVIVVELLIMFLVIGLLLINPVTFISDYPPEIQEIYYKSQNKEAEKEKLTTMMIIKKVVVLIVLSSYLNEQLLRSNKQQLP